MNKNFIRIKALVFTLVSTVLASLLVINAEVNKKNLKAIKEENYYKGLYDGWEKYKSSYLDQLSQVIETNKKSMEDAKTQYHDLLSKQPELIAEHKTISQVSIPQSDQTVRKVSVTKPTSKPKTRAS